MRPSGSGVERVWMERARLADHHSIRLHTSIADLLRTRNSSAVMPTLTHLLLTRKPLGGGHRNRDPVTRISSLTCSGPAAAVARVATLTVAAVGHAAGISLDMAGVPIPVAGFGVLAARSP
jgi:hypothetical protein